MPKISSGGAGGMLDGLKSRLGFNRGEEDYDNGYDDYDDYDDGYEGGYDDYADDRAGDSRNYDSRNYDDYNDGYDDASVGGYRPARAGSGRYTRSSRDLSQNLVSIEDVKASTRVPERLTRDPLAQDDSYTTRGGRNVIDHSAPEPYSPAYNAAARDGRSRSEGLDSLFTPSDSRSYDPYEAYSSSTPSAHSPARQLTVIKPTAYGDVERVARAVKSGDVVVLAMRNTPDDLSKRILDFAFGVASALDANVECPGDKVFAIARGMALTDTERFNLRTQGVL